MTGRTVHVELLPASEAGSVVPLSRLTRAAQLDVQAEAVKPHCRIWIAKSTPVGAPEAYTLCWWVADELQVVDLATAPEARRRGLARALLDAVRAFAVENGIASLWLEVRSDNMPALTLYESSGFDRVRTRPRYYADGTDALEMACFLSDG